MKHARPARPDLLDPRRCARLQQFRAGSPKIPIFYNSLLTPLSETGGEGSINMIVCLSVRLSTHGTGGGELSVCVWGRGGGGGEPCVCAHVLVLLCVFVQCLCVCARVCACAFLCTIPL